ATKTRAVVLAGGAARNVATVRSASAYHREPEEAAAVVAEAARAALAQAGLTPPVAALGAGLAGADDPDIRERLERALRGAGVARLVAIDHDAAVALAGGTALQPGIVIVAGTGSVAFGVDAAGRRARAGGWGPLLNDEGSGYDVGRAILRAAMQAFDGRGPATALAEEVRARFGLASLASLKLIVRGLSIDQVAAVAPLAAGAARAGDAVALRIMANAGEALAAMVAAVARRLGWAQTPFALVATGGMFEAGEMLRGPMLRALAAAGCVPRLRPARFPPEVGAALLAARAAGADVEGMVRDLSRAFPPVAVEDGRDP
ncbi:MAG: BadF/BadG/BcrA/BcrD ATPase family protein, partial [Armatimonadota bacterium]|nr:BadF/BadG/BcrA/BcrD ATPase family protein [Armatimonadota bacterium]